MNNKISLPAFLALSNSPIPRFLATKAPTAVDGKVDFKGRTRDIYNLIRGVAAPFPGAFAYVVKKGNEYPQNTEDLETLKEQYSKITIWEAHPFDEMMDFSEYAPGEVVDIFDGKLIVRTVDGSLLIDRYECDREITVGDILV